MTATLAAVAEHLEGAETRGPDATVVDATHDSRQVAPGWLFCAVPGEHADGHDHAEDAVAAGAAGLLVERWLDVDCAQIRVPSVRAAMGPAAAVVHGHPSRSLTVVGVTGTNGKTTLTYLLEGAFGAAGRGTGVIGTIESRIHGEPTAGVRTTPEGTDLQRLLATMQRRGVEAVAMEVSSHGLDLHRVDGTNFAVAVFTNLSQDHLDWHGTMDAYFAAKARLFEPELTRRAVVCVDDEWGVALAERACVPIVTVGHGTSADARMIERTSDVQGGRAVLAWDGRELEVRTRLPARFNVTNAVLAVVAAVSAGVDEQAAIEGVAASDGAPGRLERVDAGQPFTVLVDYAHTPAAIESVLSTLRSDAEGRIVLVVGAGGDRDPGKREPMGRVSALADHVVVTSDNPRSEDPMAIIASIVEGVEQSRSNGAQVELHVDPDRTAAIRFALGVARPGDVVVIVGKGHETTQQFADTTIDFDDREVAAQLLREQGLGS